MICNCGVMEACNLCEGDNQAQRLYNVLKTVQKIIASDPQNIYCRQATIILDSAINHENKVLFGSREF